jgi:hypothetical protein
VPGEAPILPGQPRLDAGGHPGRAGHRREQHRMLVAVALPLLQHLEGAGHPRHHRLIHMIVHPRQDALRRHPRIGRIPHHPLRRRADLRVVGLHQGLGRQGRIIPAQGTPHHRPLAANGHHIPHPRLPVVIERQPLELDAPQPQAQHGNSLQIRGHPLGHDGGQRPQIGACAPGARLHHAEAGLLLGLAQGHQPQPQLLPQHLAAGVDPAVQRHPAHMLADLGHRHLTAQHHQARRPDHLDLQGLLPLGEGIEDREGQALTGGEHPAPQAGAYEAPQGGGCRQRQRAPGALAPGLDLEVQVAARHRPLPPQERRPRLEHEREVLQGQIDPQAGVHLEQDLPSGRPQQAKARLQKRPPAGGQPLLVHMGIARPLPSEVEAHPLVALLNFC